jgi:hypothetical protein
MQEGQWEITSQSDMPGMPAAARRAHTFTTCINKKDLVPQQKEQQQSECKMQDKSISGNTVTWTMVCPNVTSKGSSTYAGNTFEGTSQTVMKHGGTEMVMNAVVKGKYIGPCPQPQPQK